MRAKELKALEVNRLSSPGRHSVGGIPGLSLNITKTGARSWILRVIVGVKRRHIGLGAFPEVTLANARVKATEERRKIALGIDPVDERMAMRDAQRVEQNFLLTFEGAFNQYFIEKLEGELKNEKHTKQWRATLTTYAFPMIGEKLVSQINVDDILDLLRPIWPTKNETASRVTCAPSSLQRCAESLGLNLWR
jgi:hypothetical protein